MNPLDELIVRCGGTDRVAEISGRTHRQEIVDKSILENFSEHNPRVNLTR